VKTGASIRVPQRTSRARGLLCLLRNFFRPPGADPWQSLSFGITLGVQRAAQPWRSSKPSAAPFTLRLYLEAPPTREALSAVIHALDLTPRTFLRRKEDAFKTLGLAEASEDACLDAMVTHPVLIERPVLVAGDRAALGRPDTTTLTALLDALAEESSP